MRGLQRRKRCAAVVAGAAALLVMTAGCSGSSAGGGTRETRGVSYWVDGATVESVAKTLQVQVPATATEAKAAHLNGLQDDNLILAFVLPTAEVDGFVAGLKPEAPLRLREQPLTFDSDATAPFTHLGLPAPDLLGQVREGQICAPCKGDLNWLKISVASVDGQNSRIYLSGVD